MVSSVTKRGFTSADFAVVRSPLLAFDTLERLGAGLSACSDHVDDLADALSRDRKIVVGRLRDHLKDPSIREAIFVASPTLDEAIDCWLREPESPRAKGVPSILLRYLARMSARATPFGAFSSCRVARVGADATSLGLGDRTFLVRHTRLDLQYLARLIGTLERDPLLRAELRYWPNTTLSLHGAHAHYAEWYEADPKGTRRPRLVSIDAGPFLETVLVKARDGATPAEIAGALVAEHRDLADDDGPAAARDFVNDLIDAQVLQSDLEVPITGGSPIDHVLDVLAETRAGRGYADVLSEARDQMRAMDRSGLGGDRASYVGLRQTLVRLPASIDPSPLVQLDLSGSGERLALGQPLMAEIERGVALLHRMASKVEHGGSELDRFREAFRARYEEREVPLVEALDDESGIGFGAGASVPAEIIEGLELGPPVAPPFQADAREAWLLHRVAEMSGAARWELEESDFDALRPKEEASLIDAFAASVTIAAPSVAAIERGDYQLVMVAGLGGAEQLGRFGELDPLLRDGIARYVTAVDALRPDVIAAEIVHMPDGRGANIVGRPAFRPYEIPCLGRSAVSPDHRIPIDDLMVSVEGALVRLRSRRLGRWVEPRMTNAHNTRVSGLGVYRFLAAVRNQEIRSLPGWYWGGAAGLPHLPRVTSGRFVLSLEQWNLGRRAIAGLERGEPVDRFRAVQELRRASRWPRWISLLDGQDQLLVIDLDNVLACETFCELVKGRDEMALVEVFPGEGELPAEGEGGRFVMEIILPLRSTRNPSQARAVPTLPTVPRRFVPGSQWLYVKLYAGQATLDALLREVVAPVVARAIESGAAKQWHFVRYADPQQHLRLRFEGNPDRLLETVLRDLIARAETFSGEMPHRVVVDTYEREVERYGGDRGIELAEALFHADSYAALRAIQAADGTTDSQVRWKLALVGMHRMMENLGIEGDGRLELVGSLRDAFAAEFRLSKKTEHDLGARYRNARREIEALLDGVVPAGPASLVKGLEAIEARSADLVSIGNALRSIRREGGLAISLFELAASLLHMHANRILIADPRAQELVIYDYLHRFYRSRNARGRRDQDVC